MASHMPTARDPASPSSVAAPAPSATDQRPRAQPRKRKGHRGGKKKRSRRKSFAALADDSQDEMHQSPADAFYKMPPGNLSDTSIDSEALLDHREQRPMRFRRTSTAAAAAASPFHNPYSTPAASRLRSMQTPHSDEDRGESHPWDETVPLLPDATKRRASPTGPSSYGASDTRPGRNWSRRDSSKSSRTKLAAALGPKDAYDVNHPPSVPGSPNFGATDHPEMTFGDVMIRDELSLGSGSPRHVIDGDEDRAATDGPLRGPDHGRRLTAASAAECYTGHGLSELGEEDAHLRDPDLHQYRARRRRSQWPDLSILEEWRRFEKEDQSEEGRVKKITEPQLINGRLRPVRKGWFQTDDDAPYRFTYFNEEFQSTIHSPTISELVQPGSDFRELFIPDPRILSDDESDDDDETVSLLAKPTTTGGGDGESRTSTRQPSVAESRRDVLASPSRDGVATGAGAGASGRATPIGIKSPETGGRREARSDDPYATPTPKPPRFGDRPVWWLDIVCPTEAEMKVICKAFGIHPLTAEDIMVQEAREKVELFRHYYFVNYRTFDQDINSDNYLEPVNMYVVVFREGVLSFHFSMTPHPANVRRRIRQLRDYLILSSDWISYAIIDDITDVFQPLIQNIEDEVDEIDEQILQLHSSAEKRLKDETQPQKNDDNNTAIVDSSDMLRRVGDCRKRVMSLYRLLGNKADVIKGFAKRCNERWEVAPRSEIGLYLGDIQDHIVTMTSNLGHYEKILARSHGNYLAQINIRMNERQEQTADVLGKLTVLGTIVLPMNIITGLWGMNVWVPGQQYEGDLAWFVWITAGLVCFGLACYLIAKRVYKIV
ncbi:corA-like Mg2+ transporter protein [Hirsutella rhossiliensis]|uniref:CorA-like mg2+ transporter protein n=1 Tax=Hirsutella rhossiliensis TaxID=111463 RepID=A0A9P8SIL3_9HYPO|nr:corA-like mg2+ transporter protein [Hirsutella rhossiliensis]KAH0963304.1 corA-like mg2+ transporter protein [Hirsutella rhossiliensis]